MVGINLLLTNILSSNSLELSLLGEAIFKAFWRCTPVVSWFEIISFLSKTTRFNFCSINELNDNSLALSNPQNAKPKAFPQGKLARQQQFIFSPALR